VGTADSRGQFSFVNPVQKHFRDIKNNYAPPMTISFIREESELWANASGRTFLESGGKHPSDSGVTFLKSESNQGH
jgi:hypothetical protein